MAPHDMELELSRLAGGVLDGLSAEAQRALREAGEDTVPASAGLWGDLGGTDIAVAIDGGRMNIRTARPGRVAADRSRHGHHTDWREPRLHIICEVGKGGRLQRGGRQLAGGTPGSPDGLAALPAADLRRVGAASARRVTFPGDGPSGSGGGWTPSRRPPGSRPGNARAAWTTTMRSGILRCSPSTRGSGTRASACGGWTA